MFRHSSERSALIVVALLVGFLTTSEVVASGGPPRSRGPRPSAHHPAPHHSAAPVRRSQPNNRAMVQPHRNTGRASTSAPHVANRVAPGVKHPTVTSAAMAPGNRSIYGAGTSFRHYTARGYGRGYQNHYYGSRGYGRSQGNARSIVNRLRSVHASLVRLDHDYQGHRVQAMHAISRAIHQLSHRSVASRSINLARGSAVRRVSTTGGIRQVQPLTQAQSDSRMAQAMRTTQGINLQLSEQGRNSANHVRAHGYLQRAVHELRIALAVR